VNESGDLLFLELRCGETILSYEWINGSVYVQNYSCAELGYETSKELTVGAHALEFRYGGVSKYAYNTVSNLNFTAPTAENGSTIAVNWTQVNVSLSVSDMDAFRFHWNGTNYSVL